MSLIEIEQPAQNPKRFPKSFMLVAISMAIISMGVAVGALINAGGGASATTELGMGLVETPACDNEITFQPYASIENREDPAITLNEIQISEISSNCAGKDFIITAIGDDGSTLALSRNESNTTYTSVRIYFSKFLGINDTVSDDGILEGMFTLVDGNPYAIGVKAISGLDQIADLPDNPAGSGIVDWNGDDPYLYWEMSEENNSVSITFNPAPIGGSSLEGFLNPRIIKLFTLESTDHVEP
jgi:hypothetical protein